MVMDRYARALSKAPCFFFNCPHFCFLALRTHNSLHTDCCLFVEKDIGAVVSHASLRLVVVFVLKVGSSDLRWLLGMLTQPEEGKYFLEDLVTRLPLDLSSAVSFCESITFYRRALRPMCHFPEGL